MLKAAPECKLLPEPYEPKIDCAMHLENGLTPATRKDILDRLIHLLGYYQFDAIAFRGLSGALFAPAVAILMNKTLLAVRKGEKCHSGREVEGDYNARRYVIIDDFVSSGTTVREIIEKIKYSLPRALCIGVIEYNYILGQTAQEALKPVHQVLGGSFSIL